MSSSIISLESKLASLTSVMATETRSATLSVEMVTYSIISASIDLVSAKEALSTATDSSVASEVVSSVSSLLNSLLGEYSPYGMIPDKVSNLAMTAVYALLLTVNAFLGVFYQTWWFGITTSIGLAMELIGYIARYLSINDVFSTMKYAMQMATLTFAPAFIMAGVYYVLAQLVYIYGKEEALMKPTIYKRVFIGCDALSFLVQAAGGGISSASVKNEKLGLYIMIAGTAIQLIGMSGFLFLFCHYFIKIGYVSGHLAVRERCGELPARFAHIRKGKLFGYFPIAMLIAVILIYIRSVYRIVEMSQGFSGFLMTHEIYTTVFDGVLVALACLLLIIFHPGLTMGRGDPVKKATQYEDADMSFQSDMKSAFGGANGQLNARTSV